jgi:aldehyde dehydrogenase (NAD+)
MPTALGNCSLGSIFNSGQICAAASRLYVQEDIAATFIESLKAQFETSSKALGADPKEKTTQMSPSADKQQLDRVMSFIEMGKKTAQLLTGGSRKGEKGCFLAPTIFLNPTPDCPIYKEEIFGPVLVVKTFKTEEEVIQLANDTTYGLVGKTSICCQISFTCNCIFYTLLTKRVATSSMHLHERHQPRISS